MNLQEYLTPFSNYQENEPFIQSKRQSEMNVVKIKALTRIKEYYMNVDQRVPNDHPLVNAIIQMNAISHDPYKIYLLAREQSERIASQLRWFNGSTPGKILTKPFFFMNPEVKECIVAYEFEDSFGEVLRQINEEDSGYWKSWSPVRVIYHPFTDMDYGLCSIPHHGMRLPLDHFKVATIKVDLPLLYLQWRYYERKYREIHGDVEVSIHRFLVNYPLTNMVESQMDVAYFNRMYCYFTENRLYGNLKISPRVMYLDTYREIDNSILEIEKKLKKVGGLDFSRLTNNLPRLMDEKYGHWFSPEGMGSRSQNAQVILSSTLPLYSIWLKLVKQYQAQKWNKNDLTHVKRGITKLKIANVLSHDTGINQELKAVIDDLYNQYV